MLEFSRRDSFFSGVYSLPLASQATEKCWSSNERERHTEYVFSNMNEYVHFPFSDVAIIFVSCFRDCQGLLDGSAEQQNVSALAPRARSARRVS